MFIKSLIALASVGFFVVLGELVRHYSSLHRELTRKVVHIGAAVAIAVWPFYLSWGTVNVLALILLVGVLVSQRFNLAGAVHNIRRKSYGEPLFALAILGVATFAPSPAVYCAAILHLGLADGLAAVTGTIWGKKSQYRVLGDRKSVVGSATFFITSLLILIGFNIWALNPVPMLAVFILPFIATAFENIGLRGTDNITVPMLVVIVLSSF